MAAATSETKTNKNKFKNKQKQMHSLIRNDPIKISIKTIWNAGALAVETKKRENS
jgi:hypothetical protein